MKSNQNEVKMRILMSDKMKYKDKTLNKEKKIHYTKSFQKNIIVAKIMHQTYRPNTKQKLKRKIFQKLKENLTKYNYNTSVDKQLSEFQISNKQKIRNNILKNIIIPLNLVETC